LACLVSVLVSIVLGTHLTSFGIINNIEVGEDEEEEEGRKCSLAYGLSCIIIVIIIISYIIRRRRGGREFTLGCLYFGRAVLAWREKSWQQQGDRRRGRKRIEVVV